jgi:hypothetical protein
MTSPVRKSRFEFLRHVAPILGIIPGVLFLAGFMLIGFYVASGPEPHLGYLGVGWLTACTAFVAGRLAGLVVGIPRFVSSGALWHDVEARRLSASQDQASQDQASRFAPSINLAKISDWLTKLLLGAGLVGLTRLGRPLDALVDAVARGLRSATPSGYPEVIAAAILATYVVFGFLTATSLPPCGMASTCSNSATNEFPTSQMAPRLQKYAQLGDLQNRYLQSATRIVSEHIDPAIHSSCRCAFSGC